MEVLEVKSADLINCLKNYNENRSSDNVIMTSFRLYFYFAKGKNFIKRKMTAAKGNNQDCDTSDRDLKKKEQFREI